MLVFAVLVAVAAANLLPGDEGYDEHDHDHHHHHETSENAQPIAIVKSASESDPNTGKYSFSFETEMVFQSARTVNRNVTVITPKKLATLLVDLTLSLMMELHTQLRGMLMRLDIMLKAPIYRPCPLSNQPHLNQSIHLVK